MPYVPNYAYELMYTYNFNATDEMFYEQKILAADSAWIGIRKPKESLNILIKFDPSLISA